MKRAVGHLDKRKRVTRCQACYKRRIKCEDGYPCKYCVRTNKTCEPQKPVATEVEFVAFTGLAQSRRATRLAVQVSKHMDTLYLEQFALFMQRCQFTRRFASVTTDLMHLMQGCPSLRDVAIAIGALDASRRSSVRLLSGQNSPRNIALGMYGRSLQALQAQLANTVSVQCDGILWCTFLLGLFELMSQTFGDQWAHHMRYGTSRLLQLAGPSESLSLLHQTLFDAFRILEATRAIMYGDGTFLSQKAWLSYHPNPATNRSGSSDPMSSIHTLMIQTSSYSKLLFEQLNRVPESLRSTDPTIDALARHGIQIQNSIRSWYDTNDLHLSCSDAYVQLALANYHALELFHCRNYTFHSCWANKTVPSLTQREIDTHVASILYLSEQSLDASIIPGITLLFPLRMAGANTLNSVQMTKVVDILGRVHRSGFIVSDRIKTDVQDLWQFLASQKGSVQELESKG